MVETDPAARLREIERWLKEPNSYKRADQLRIHFANAVKVGLEAVAIARSQMERADKAEAVNAGRKDYITGLQSAFNVAIEERDAAQDKMARALRSAQAARAEADAANAAWTREGRERQGWQSKAERFEKDLGYVTKQAAVINADWQKARAEADRMRGALERFSDWGRRKRVDPSSQLGSEILAVRKALAVGADGGVAPDGVLIREQSADASPAPAKPAAKCPLCGGSGTEYPGNTASCGQPCPLGCKPPAASECPGTDVSLMVADEHYDWAGLHCPACPARRD